MSDSAKSGNLGKMEDDFNDSTGELDDHYEAAFLKPGIFSSILYQKKILTWVILSLVCKKDPKINTWGLATEVSKARGFHDLVLRYTTNDNNISYCFIQIKHSRDPKKKLLDNDNLVFNTKLNREGSLSYLFKSYLNMRKKYENIESNQIENLTVFTNMMCDTELLMKLENDKLYSFEGKGNRYRFDIDKLQRKKPIMSRLKQIKVDDDMVTDDCIVDFLNKLVFMVDQPSEPELENMIIEEMRSIFNAPQIFYNNLYKDIDNWSRVYKKIDGVGCAPYIIRNQVLNNLKETEIILLKAKGEEKFVKKKEIFDGISELDEIKSLSL